MKECIKKKCIAIYEFFYEKFRIIKLRLFYNLDIMDSQNTIEYIIENKCSISRYGDGEFLIMLGVGEINFQKKSDLLTEKLAEIIKKGTTDKLLVCLPHYINKLEGLKKKPYKYWYEWGRVRQPELVSYIKKNRVKKCLYGDSLISRPYIDYIDSKNADNIFPLLKKIWNNRDVIIVEGEQTRLGIGNDLFDECKSVKRIIAPAKNASERYSEIINCVKNNWHGELILIALGPTATALAADFADMNMQALDIGHIDIEYEWFLRNAKEKIPVKGKFINEVYVSQEIGVCDDMDYTNQIIDKIL